MHPINMHACAINVFHKIVRDIIIQLFVSLLEYLLVLPSIQAGSYIHVRSKLWSGYIAKYYNVYRSACEHSTGGGCMQEEAEL